jgi:hypothetical protein
MTPQRVGLARRTLLRLGSAALALALAATGAAGQTESLPGTGGGAFESLSPGNQRIARALFDAQRIQAPAGGDAATATTRPLTLDEIAARKQGGRGWTQVFEEMKAQGLVQEQHLGQVVKHAFGNMASQGRGK